MLCSLLIPPEGRELFLCAWMEGHLLTRACVVYLPACVVP